MSTKGLFIPIPGAVQAALVIQAYDCLIGLAALITGTTWAQSLRMALIFIEVEEQSG